MAVPLMGRFDEETETRFLRAERERLVPFVRAYAVIVGAILMVYTVVNPLFFDQGDEIRFSGLLATALLVLGGYFGATFWHGYLIRPAIDFICLLALATILTADNVILYNELNRIGAGGHASIAISGLIVSAFVAISFAGRPRWFLGWFACHAIVFSVVLFLLESTAAGHVYSGLSYLTGAIVMFVLNLALTRAHRQSFVLQEELDIERAKTEELLFNVLPQTAAQRIRAGQVVADAYSDASVVFADVMGFTQLSKSVSPGHLIDLLNSLFSVADRCAAETGVEKVKTIGDAYLAISGGNSPAENSALSAIAFARALIAGLEEVRASTGLDVHVRIGIHSGPVVGGVIGETRMAYDYWGETMNIASRIEGVADRDGIAVSEATYLRSKGEYEFGPPEAIMLKGVGEMPVYKMAAR
ncbi:adenylate/guanylate cyclase domain-containing protein [Parasphingopyxis marina]|uniref:Adenylate/guanylate cyclase domain-containing protein n=1 Tax=Parasphingopyxis marina TaxID=2761622 RepID=A0A842I0S4_9SPHN|nr:adenylate/guanylate cyclase domain-containing protein [Parasphingopyxis marina]MBC2778283.1 adenylate/guanylate cyclase domain-containing protein [Parasphingopyxis marina]